MRRILALTLAAAAATALVSADFADARRLGGGRTIGAQRQSVAPPASTPPAAAPAAPSGAAANPVMPAQPGAAATASRAAPGAAAAPASGMSRWLGPVAGLAAGLGLAALAAHLGLSEALMSALLIALAVFAGIAILRMILARRAVPPRGPMAYSPSAAAQRTAFEPTFGGARNAPAAPVAGRYPPGFDPVPFLEQAKQQFRRLQTAYDAGDRAALADVMTPEMLAEVTKDLDSRGPQFATEVVSLANEIVDVSTEGDRHWASVRFSGLVREDGANAPKPFDERWNLVKPVDGSSGGLLAGIRQIDDIPAGHA